MADGEFVYHMMQQESWDGVPTEFVENVLVPNKMARDDGMNGYIVEDTDPDMIENAMRDFGHDPSEFRDYHAEA